MDETGKPSAEDEAWLDDFAEKMSRPTEAEKEFFARRRALGLGVGLDEDGNLVYETPPTEKPKNLKLILAKDSHRTPNAVAANRPRNGGGSSVVELADVGKGGELTLAAGANSVTDP